MEYVERVLYRLPDETEAVAHYLSAVAGKHPTEVRDVVTRFLLNPAFRHEWQEVWMYHVLTRCPPLGDELMVHLEKISSNVNLGWFVRTSALNLLARNGRGDRALAARMWELSPPQFRSEIIAAATWREADPEWRKLLEGCRGDPVQEVVVAHVGQLRAG
jgi:hypothetical protein